MKKLFTALLIASGISGYGQRMTKDLSDYLKIHKVLNSYPHKNGFIYSPGIVWTENSKQDSVVDIFIEGDTMKAIRNLLEYCLMVKSENDNAYAILETINLDVLKKRFNDFSFSYYVNERKKILAENKKKELKIYPR